MNSAVPTCECGDCLCPEWPLRLRIEATLPPFSSTALCTLLFYSSFSCATAVMDRLGVAASMVGLLMAARKVAGILASVVSNAQDVPC